MKELYSTTEVIEALGGVHAVARITGKEPNAVQNWRRFPTFPAHVYLVMSTALAGHGCVASPALWRQIGVPSSNQGEAA